MSLPIVEEGWAETGESRVAFAFKTYGRLCRAGIVELGEGEAVGRMVDLGTAVVLAGLSGDVERYDLLVKVTNGYVKILRG